MVECEQECENIINVLPGLPGLLPGFAFALPDAPLASLLAYCNTPLELWLRNH
jgi:hypothetical protein